MEGRLAAVSLCAALGVLAGLGATGAGCQADCTPSADIQVMVVPSGGVNPQAIATLRIILSVDGGPNKVLDVVPPHAISSSSALILRPDPPPTAKYSVAITVEALTASGALIAVGTTAGEVVANGCNRLEALLAALPVPPDSGTPLPPIDGFTPADLAGIDMAGCFGTTPDEDGDGRADQCDLCPADFDPQPVDSDRDGLPDACDPDPTKPQNSLLYFEPFNSDSGQWSGGLPINNSYIDLSTDNSPTGFVVTGNGSTALPVNVRVQTSVYTPVAIVGSASDVGLFLGNSPNPGGGSTSGMMCAMVYDQQQRTSTLQLQEIQNGNVATTALMPVNFMNQVNYRIRLTQRGASYTCESATMNGPGAVTVTMQASAAPTGPQFVALHAQNIEAHFHSVVAETALPQP